MYSLCALVSESLFYLSRHDLHFRHKNNICPDIDEKSDEAEKTKYDGGPSGVEWGPSDLVC